MSPKIIGLGFDRARTKRNSANEIVYSETNKRIALGDLVYPNTATDTTRSQTAGFINYIFDYQTSINNEQIAIYKDHVKNITNQIGFKIGGFTDKNKFKLLLDSRTPLNEGNVFVPEENYKIFLNSSFPQQEVSYSGVIVEKRPEGYYIKGYDNQNPKFNYYPTSERSNDPLINVGGVSEAYVDWSSGKVYVVGTIVKNSNSLHINNSHVYYNALTHQGNAYHDVTARIEDGGMWVGGEILYNIENDLFLTLNAHKILYNYYYQKSHFGSFWTSFNFDVVYRVNLFLK